MIVGGYELHLYCPYVACRDMGSYWLQMRGEFSEPTRAAAFRAARRAGWRFGKEGECVCKHCAAQGRKPRGDE
jgi:hypothetical protein